MAVDAGVCGRPARGSVRGTAGGGQRAVEPQCGADTGTNAMGRDEKARK